MANITASITEATCPATGALWADKITLTATDLPALSGTPKQIAYAETIRAKALCDVGEAMTRQAHAIRQTQSAATILDGANKALPKLAEKLDGRTSAAWWIDNQDKMGVAAVRTIVAG